MRRPLLIIFIIVLFVGFIYTNKVDYDNLQDDKMIAIEGLVKEKNEKVKYNQYKVGQYLVNDYSKKHNLKVGQLVFIKGKAKSLDSMNFKDFDYGKYVRSIGCKGILYVEEYKVLGNNILYTYIEKIKTYLIETSRYLYKYNSDFMNSLLLGEKSSLSDEQKEVFNRTGTSHIIAISGLHTGILCTLVVFIIRGMNKFYKLIFLLTIMTFYSIMIGNSPSIIRSIAFVITLYIAVFLDKKKDKISILSLIGIFLVINNPYILYNVSFQLSFMATLSIIYFYGYINKIIKIKLISLTISANILTLPIIYYNFKAVAMLSIIGNIIIVPFIAVIMYLSILSLIIFKMNIMLAKLIAYVNTTIFNSIYFLLEVISNLEFAYIEVKDPSIHCVAIYYTVMFLYMSYKELKVMKEQENGLQGYYKENEG